MAVAMAKLGAKLILSSRSQRKLEASRTDRCLLRAAAVFGSRV